MHSSAFNARGEDYSDRDNAGRETRTIDDDAGRTVETIQNYAVDDSGQPVDEADENLVSATTFHVTQQMSADATLSPYTGSPITATGGSFTFLLERNFATGAIATPPRGPLFVMFDAASGGFLLVNYDNSGWTVWEGTNWNPIATTASDVLVAEVGGFTRCGVSVTDLTGSVSIYEGVQRGYRSGDISVTPSTPTSGYVGDIYYESYTFTITCTNIVPYYSAEETETDVYGTGVGDSSPALFSNDLLRAVIYADSTNTWTSVVDDAGGDMVEYTYDRQSETTTMTDQNGTTHAYAYDGIGHELTDSITVPSGNPANIDLTVTEIAMAYKVCGRFLSATSLNASDEVVNEVLDEYDTNGNLDAVYQQHNTFTSGVSGAVNTSTGGGKGDK